MQTYYVSQLISLATLIAAGWFSIHLAIADASFREHTPESVARAVELEPHNADYLALRAMQLDYDGSDGTATAVLEQEAALSPLTSAPRIRLGLAAEIRGDNATAERWLLDAASIDHQFEPRWTLANFYFRQQRSEDFWKWMRQALEISYGDRRPAFDLCWRMADSQTVLSRAIPESREVIANYLWYVLESHRDALAPVAIKLVNFHYPNDRSQLLVANDALLDMHDTRGAAELWKALGNPPPSGVTNPTFARAPLQHGFDWRWSDVVGVDHVLLEQPSPALRIALDGREPETATLLTQIVNLTLHARYTLRWEASASGLQDPIGIEWNIGDQHTTASMDRFDFTASAELVPLTLSYRRPLGQARAEGSIEIKRVEITAR